MCVVLDTKIEKNLLALSIAETLYQHDIIVKISNTLFSFLEFSVNIIGTYKHDNQQKQPGSVTSDWTQ